MEIMKPKDFTVGRNERAACLLDFIAQRLGVSRNKAKGLLDARAVLVNGRRVWMARHRLGPGDAIRVVDTPSVAANRRDGLTTLFQDEDCLVVDKPPGLLTNEGRSVESRLRTLTGEAGICAAHRLDRDTSGCLIFARHADARAALIASFRAGHVKKMYHALAWGKPDRDERTLVSSMDGVEAVTHVRVLDANRHASHWLIRIETGRTHQIRKHLLGLGCPVVGDRQYGSGVATLPDFEAPRQMLHASRVEFPHPRTSVLVRVEAPLPDDFRQAMKRLRLT